MGTSSAWDDVLILANPYDSSDHYQDGYNIYSATQFYRVHFNNHFTTCYGIVYLEESPSNPLTLILIIAGAVVVLGGAVVTYFII